MEFSPIKYQSSIFCDLYSLIPEPSLIQALFSKLFEWDVFPSIVKELTVQFNSNSNSVQKTPIALDRIQFISSNREKRISFFSNRIDFEFFLSPAVNEYGLDKFEADLLKLSTNILSVINKKVNRISLVTGYYNPNSKNIFDTIPLNQTIELDGEMVSALDWKKQFTYRKTIKLQGKPEVLNLNAIFGKNVFNQQVSTIGITTDTLELLLDINTVPENKAYRFTDLDITSFYKQAFKLNEQFKNNILAIFSQ